MPVERLPLGFYATRIVVGGEFFYPDVNSPQRGLRPIILFYSGSDKKLIKYSSPDSPEFPRHISALAISSDTIFTNGDKGVVFHRDDSTAWTRLPGIADTNITALAWIDGTLWVGTPKRILLYRGLPGLLCIT